MRSLAYIIAPLLCIAQISAKDLTIQAVKIELKDRTWFTDRSGVAVVWLDEAVSAPNKYTSSTKEVSILEIDTLDTPHERTGKYAALIRYLPRKVGSVTLPTLEFTSETHSYQTKPIEFEVSEPIQSDEMSLTIQPHKTTVYVGEPVRFDLVWDTSVEAAKLQSLKLYPDFFSDSNIEIVIPRNTSEETQQVGMPIGGRRVIATRTLDPNDKKALGRIELPLYLRFSKEGTYTLPATRLECAQLNAAGSEFARYAAHFNNSLFDEADGGRRYQRIYTYSPALDIEVRPLPANDTGIEFTGLFAPIDIEVNAMPTKVEIGQLMQLDISINGNAPHGMIELAPLNTQSGLRERFLVDNNLGRIWKDGGTQFKARLRPLTTSIQAIPSLQFAVFDTTSGKFERHSTEAIPLTTLQSNGADYIPLNTFQGAAVTLTHQPAGIWHNLQANRMNDLLNTLFDLLSRYFWTFIILGPIGFAILLPVARNRRRRELDTRYRLRADAYKQLKQAPAGTEEQWNAFRNFMAAHFESHGEAWTLSDSQRALLSIGASDDIIEHITALHKATDARDFGDSSEHPAFSKLQKIAKQVLNATAKISIVAICIVLFSKHSLQAEDWNDAEQLFIQAQAETPGSNAANSLYQQAALKFQAEATSGKHAGEAWVNAGNAWFKAGAIGRSIAAYRIALSYRPFDTQLADNLTAARAMTLNDIQQERKWWQKLPTSWIKVTVVIVNSVFWISLLLIVRYRDRPLMIASAISGVCLIFVSVFLLQHSLAKITVGVVVVDALNARKGPNETYAKAFNEPLHDGTEFSLIDKRGDWIFVELSDGRRCWLLGNQTTSFVW